jgi:hypothetical protein
MNCFEAKNDFIGLWQKTLVRDRRAEVLTHLALCSTCDHSFRVFALTAPVLYSPSEPDRRSAAPLIRTGESGFKLLVPAPVAHRPRVRALNTVLPGLVTAAAALIAFYFAGPAMTFEDAIAAENSNAELASYPPNDSVFGQELMASDSTINIVYDE